KLFTILILLTTVSCLTDKEDVAIFDPVLTDQDLNEEKLKEKGFEKITLDSVTLYLDKDDFREIKYEIVGDDIVSRTYKIKYTDLDKFLKKYDGELFETQDQDDVIKLKLRDKEVKGKITSELDGRHIEIFTDWFHIVIKD